MCPVCIATAVLIACKVASSGGIAAVAIKKFCANNVAGNNPVPTSSKENQHG